ncbi:bifunctional acetate--CoA ligase family protein/GNAT family N-acetyltransferase [Flexibacterium corallicola]|uniref:bifunctional acetate--CoA ligase family protein/GNAT family N-acetyltransferase n=1 Tax=Flexibacterium corallicola TaxID=3037259 RepID=UPI00286EFBB8|nr:bifunctional acetate--CoA ligase family protein/GNAT family N-acetyltransferase [Pseudovibrio sp. M1P-2-3]
MTIRNIEGLLAPKSLAVVGPNVHSSVLLRHILNKIAKSAFTGKKYAVGIGRDVPDGFEAVAKPSLLPQQPDLFIYLGTPQRSIHLVRKAGQLGTRAFLIPASGYDKWQETTIKRMLKAARPHNLRILGPGSLGVASPHLGLSALLTEQDAKPGDLALISRSGTIFNATMAWAKSHDIGFSGVASLGRRADVDVSDLLDWYAQDFRTRAILVHVETLTNPRKFLSAARAAARAKPVIVIRSGASRDANTYGDTHGGHLASNDLVYDAALQRAGVLRVDDLDEMFHAVETVTRIPPPKGKRLAIIANGRSLATLAADRLVKLEGELSTLTKETLSSLKHLTRSDAKVGNPLVLREGAGPEDFDAGIAALLKDEHSDAVLIIAAPTAFNDFKGITQIIAKHGKQHRKQEGRKKALIATLAGHSVEDQARLEEAKVPCYTSASEAIRSFMHLVRYREAQSQLMAVPKDFPSDYSPDKAAARAIFEEAKRKRARWLTTSQIKKLLAAYSIPMVDLAMVPTVQAAKEASEKFFETSRFCTVKIDSDDIIFKSDVNGVELYLSTPDEVEAAAHRIYDHVTTTYPTARINGFEVQPMVLSEYGLEIYAGLADNPVFGPVVVFGSGGTAVEVKADRAMDLVPLDLNLASSLIKRTHIAPLLNGYRNHPPANEEEIARLLVKLSQIALDFPQVRELDLNPVIADSNGIQVLDGRLRLNRSPLATKYEKKPRLAIAPYPTEWEHYAHLKDGREIFLRPIRPEDERLLSIFFTKVTKEDVRLRFFAPIKDFSHAFLARLVQLDYARAMAFVAQDPKTNEILGVVRIHTTSDHSIGEYAIMIQSSLKGIGLGSLLMNLIIHYCREVGIKKITGEILRENTSMLELCRRLGFEFSRCLDDELILKAELDVEGMPILS